VGYSWAAAPAGVSEVSAQAAATTDVYAIGFFSASPAPTVSGLTPGAAVVASDVVTPITWTTTDDVSVDPATLNLSVTEPGGAPVAVVVAGVAQSGWSFQAIANAGNGFDCAATPAATWVRGAWTATATARDGVGALGSDTWAWTVADRPALADSSPADGGVTTQMERIRIALRDDASYTLDTATLDIRAVPPVGATVAVYSGAAWGTGWGGYIAPAGGGTDVQIVIDTIPELLSPARWTFEVDVESTSGLTA
jgi:hypothetical protein